jgi:hypothetical protein
MMKLPEIQLDIDERIQQDPELKRVIEQATEYIIEHTHNAPAAIRWKLYRSENAIELSLSDVATEKEYAATHRFPVRYLFNNVSRDISVLNGMQKYSQVILDRLAQDVNQLVRKLREEEENGSEDLE